MYGEVAFLIKELDLDLPQQTEFTPLSHQARVAFASRCARYATPIVKLFIKNNLLEELVQVVDETLEFAEAFGGAEVVGRRNLRHFMQMAQIAKSAEKAQDAAVDRHDDVEILRSYAAYAGAWAADFSARAVEDNKGTQLVYEAMVYAAAAYCQFEKARFLLTGGAKTTYAKHAQHVSASVSDAFSADFAIVRDSAQGAFPPSLFGPLRLQVDTDARADQWRDVLVFASSTFRDMQKERDFLRDVVFPRLTEALKPYRIRPILVDLRWDLSSLSPLGDEGKQLDILRHCLREIHRCHPFFIALLGNRYGWIPDRKHMLDAIQDTGVDVNPEGLSITELEVTYALHKQGHAFFYFREGLPESIASTYRDNHGNKLDKLQQKIKEHMPDRVRPYTVTWDPENLTYGLEALGEQIFDDLYELLHTAQPPKQPIGMYLSEYRGEDPAQYCAEYLERNRGPRTPKIIDALREKYAQADSRKWLDTTLDMLVRLDEQDFATADRVGGDWDEKVEAYTVSFVINLPVRLSELYQVLLRRCEQRLDPEETFVRSLLRLIVASRNGLRESDLNSLFAEYAGRAWSHLQFANVRRYLERHLSQTVFGDWHFPCEIFQQTVEQLFLDDEARSRAHTVLGDFCALLPDTDPKRLEAIRHYFKANVTHQTAILFGAYAGDPPVPGTRQPWLDKIADVIAKEICEAEGEIPNPTAQWLCRVLQAEDISNIVAFRLCQRVNEMILPRLGFVSRLTLFGILNTCNKSLRRLLDQVPETPRPISILSLGADKELFDEVLRPMGAVNLELGEEHTLDKNTVTELLLEVRHQIKRLESESRGY